ncbi:hypothetical protein [Pleomorphomonas koreensis]|uniref:hypothetical protein n=1 Tax=Pleomorphomonas koreensis TaxID=257440 RepID=UPI000408D57D|nr:hypothetical protein [Pleomorphomonas koreensis]
MFAYHVTDPERYAIVGFGRVMKTLPIKEKPGFIGALQRRRGLKIACPEAIAFRTGFIRWDQPEALRRKLGQGNMESA